MSCAWVSIERRKQGLVRGAGIAKRVSCECTRSRGTLICGAEGLWHVVGRPSRKRARLLGLRCSRRRRVFANGR